MIYRDQNSTRAAARRVVDDLLGSAGAREDEHHDDLTPARCTPVLADAAFTGPVGAAVRAMEPHTEAHPAGILVSLLVGVGALIGRAPHQMIDGARHGCNLFALLVGPSADGRKGSAVARARNVLRRLDNDFTSRNIASGLTSGQGVTYNLRDAAPAKNDRDADVGVSDKRLLIMESEMGGALKQMQGRENTLSPVLRDAWDGMTLRTLARTNGLTATDPHIALIGQISPEELRAHVSDVDFTGGLLNRFLFVHVERARLLPFGDEPPEAVLGPPVERLRYAIPTARSTGSVGFTTAGADWWREHYAELSTGKPGRAGAATRRMAPMVRRVAMVYALCEARSAIDVRDLLAAYAVCSYSAASAALVFGGADFSPMAQRFLEALLQAGPAGCNRTHLRRVAGSNNVPAEKIRGALDELRLAGVARMTHEAGSGRHPEVWRHIHHALPTGSGAHPSPISHSSHVPMENGGDDADARYAADERAALAGGV